MKKIARLSYKMNAELTVEALKSQGIAAHMHGAKEYASIVLGGDLGNYDILVPEDQVDQAQRILSNLESENRKNTEPTEVDAKTYFRKAVMFSVIAALMLPVIFNYSALLNLKKYLQVETSIFKKTISTIFVIILQLPLVFYAYWVWNFIKT